MSLRRGLDASALASFLSVLKGISR
jgi:hypothetical protein